MKKATLLLTSLCMLNIAVAQDVETEAEKKEADEITKTKVDKMDQFIIDLNWETWLDTPDSVDLEWYSRGVNISLMYDLPLGSGNFGVAFGLGFGSQNVFMNAAVVDVLDTCGCNTTIGNTYAMLQPFDDSYSYKKHKLSLNYLDVPVEIRIRTNENESGKRWKFFVGGRIGYLVNAHTKTRDDEGLKKGFIFDNMNPFRYGVHGRIGYGKVNLTSYYSLTTVFKEGKGIPLTPFSVGLSIALF